MLRTLIDLLNAPAPGAALAAAVAAEACLEFRPEIGRDLAGALRDHRVRVKPRVERYLVARVFRRQSVPGRELPYLLDEPELR